MEDRGGAGALRLCTIPSLWRLMNLGGEARTHAVRGCIIIMEV